MQQSENWEQVMDWLVEKGHEIGRPSLPVESEATKYVNGWIENVSSHEEDVTPKVDIAARAFALSEKLPELTPIEHCFLALRIAFATGLCDALAEAENAKKNSGATPFGVTYSGAEKRCYLLIDAWHLLGRHLWMYQGYWIDDWQSHSAQFQTDNEEGYQE